MQPTEAVIAMRDQHHAATAPLAEFVPVYTDDDNWWWSIACGHHQNLFDAALDRITELERRVAELKDYELDYHVAQAQIKRVEDQIAEELTHGPNATYYALRFQAALRGD